MSTDLDQAGQWASVSEPRIEALLHLKALTLACTHCPESSSFRWEFNRFSFYGQEYKSPHDDAAF